MRHEFVEYVMSLCIQDLIEEAANSIRASIEKYLQSNCRRILSLAKLIVQKRVKMEFHGFFRYYVPSTNFPRFIDAYSYLIKCYVDQIDFFQAELKLKNQYLEVSIEGLEKLCLGILKKNPLTKYKG